MSLRPSASIPRSALSAGKLTGQNQTNEWLKIGKPIQAYLGLSDPALAALVIEAGTLPTESD